MKNSLFILICLCSCYFSSFAQSWVSIGPGEKPVNEGGNDTRGTGRVNVVRFHPGYNGSTNQTVFVGTAVGGVWKSVNNGGNWTVLNTDQLPVLSVADILFDPDDANTIYITSGDPDRFLGYQAIDMGTEYCQSRGIFRSVDGGGNWTSSSVGAWHHPVTGATDSDFWTFPTDKMMGDMLIDPDDTDNMYALVTKCTLGNPDYTTWVYRSQDGGVHWYKVLEASGDYFRDMAFKPDDPNTIYVAGVHEIYRTEDGGDNWTALSSNGLFGNVSTFLRRAIIGVTPDDPDVLYVLAAEAEYFVIGPNKFDGHHVYLSTDAGDNFSLQGTFQMTDIAHSPRVRYCMDVNPEDATEFVCGSGRVYKSTNSGNSVGLTFKSGDTHYDIHDLEYSPDGSAIFAATDGGMYYTEDLGDSWTDKSTGLATQEVTALSTAQNHSEKILIGAQDVGTNLHDPDRFSPLPWAGVFPGDGGRCYIDYADDKTMYQSDYQIAQHYIHRTFNSFIGSETPIANDEDDTDYQNFIIDPGNPSTLYYGASSVLKRSTDYGTSWTNVFDFSTLRPAERIRAIAVAPSDPDVIYVSFEGPNWSSDDTQILYKSTNGGSSWTDIATLTTDLAFTFSWETNIIDIEIHPDDPDIVCFGAHGDSEGTNDYVWCTWDGGVNWYSNSNAIGSGVNKLLFQHGTRDRLYAATDFGVKYTTLAGPGTAATWATVPGGLPNVKVSDIDINYCRGKLIAGTRGRSVWERDLMAVSATQSDRTIDENTVWDPETYKQIEGDLIIKSGYKLTVKGTVGMGAGHRIIVERGAQLWIDGGTITTSCGDQMWRGIEVWGTSSADQEPILNNPDQGLINMLNGAVIEHARDGISVIKKNDNGSVNWDGYTGGIVIARNSTFRNCRRALEFWPYQNKKAGKPTGNISYFRDCTFITDDDLNDANTHPLSFVTIWQTDGIRFWDCYFENSNGGAEQGQRGNGITTVDARFFVMPDFKNPGNRCEFTRLDYGIHAQSVNPLRTATITEADFNNNYRSIYLKGMDLAEVTNCVVNVGERILGPPYGLYLDHCNLFLVEGNEFGITYSSQAPYGIIVSNGGLDRNEIYRNTFDKMKMGLVCKEDNSLLQFLCNEFTNTADADVYIDNLGIQVWQGLCIPEEQDPAGNVFSSNDHIIVEPSAQSFWYYYSDGTNEEPVNYTTSRITLEECDDDRSCPIHTSVALTPPDNGYISQEWGDLIQLRLKRDAAEEDEEIAYYSGEYNRLFGNVARAYWNMADSIQDTIYTWNGNPDSLVNFIEEEAEATSMANPMSVLGFLLAGDVSTAENILDDVESQQTASNEYIDLLRLLVYMDDGDMNYMNIDAYADSVATALILDSNKRGSANAEALITLNEGTFFPERVEPLGSEEERLARPLQQEEQLKEQLLFSAMPNPFKEQTELYVYLPERYEHATLIIVGVRGEIVKEVNIISGENRVFLKGSEILPGIYFCSLRAKGEQLEVLRIEHIH